MRVDARDPARHRCHAPAELQRHLELSKRLREDAAHLRATLREQMQRGTGAVFICEQA